MSPQQNSVEQWVLTNLLCWCIQERLVVRIPPGFDVLGPPAHVERAFAEALFRLPRMEGLAKYLVVLEV